VPASKGSLSATYDYLLTVGANRRFGTTVTTFGLAI
jgi:hypothetical protein